MKKVRLSLALFVTLPLLASFTAAQTGLKPAKATGAAGKKKVLVVYFTRSNNTKAVATQIHELMGGDIVQLVPETPYPQDEEIIVVQAKRELETGFSPRLKTKVKNVETYDIIFVGTPNWWNSLSGPVRTFLSGYDLAGKTVVPFVTHTGSGMGSIQEDFKRLCPRSRVLSGIAIWGGDAKDARGDVSKWLRKTKLLR